jgi:hypothetical protein
VQAEKRVARLLLSPIFDLAANASQRRLSRHQLRVYGYPWNEAAQIAVQECLGRLPTPNWRGISVGLTPR